MASYTPPNVFQVPDLTGRARQLKREKAAEEMQTLAYLDRYQKNSAPLLPSDQSLAQTRWSDVEKAMDAVAANDNASTRRALQQANQAYQTVVGNGLFLKQQHARERDYVRNNFANLGMPVAQAETQLSMFANGPRTEEQQTMMVNQVDDFLLPRAAKPTAADAATFTDAMISRSSGLLNNDWLATGRLNTAKAAAWADRYLEQNIKEGDVDNIVVRHLFDQGIIGNGQTITEEDLIQVQTMAPEEKAKYVSEYRQNLKENYLAQLPTKKKMTGGNDGLPDKYRNLTISTGTMSLPGGYGAFEENPFVWRAQSTPPKESGYAIVNIPNVSLPGDEPYGIYGFGYNDQGQMVVQKTMISQGSGSNDPNAPLGAGSSGPKVATMQVVPATMEDIQYLRSSMGNAFDIYSKSLLENVGGRTMTADEYRQYISNIQ